jgi:hypothetical protein
MHVQALAGQAGSVQWSTQQSQQLLLLSDSMAAARQSLLNLQLDQQLMHTQKV